MAVDTSKCDKGIITRRGGCKEPIWVFESVTVSISGTDGREVAKGLAVSRAKERKKEREEGRRDEEMDVQNTGRVAPNMEDVVITVGC